MRAGRELGLAAAGAALLVWWLCAGGDDAAPAAAPGSPDVTTTRAADAPPVRVRRAERVVVGPPVIDSITVEKPVVCKGEENLVTVVAHDPSGDDAYVRVMVGSTRGDRVPLRLFDADGEWPQVVVHGTGDTITTAPVPSFEVADCEAPALVAIDYRLTPNAWAEYDLAARIAHAGESRGAPRAYRWSFGDGATVETTVPRVTHSYGGRPQETLASSFLVSVEAVWDDGTTARGRASLQLLNPAFESLDKKGIVQLFRELEPRFPVRGADGLVRQGVRVSHARPVPVTITRVLARRQGLDGSLGEPQPVDAAALFAGRTTIGPGEAVEARVAMDLNTDPSAYSIDYVIEGEDAEGNRALGSFSVMRPPDAPTRERHAPVTDPALKAKIERALAVTGQPTVSMEDIVRLEREGKLD